MKYAIPTLALLAGCTEPVYIEQNFSAVPQISYEIKEKLRQEKVQQEKLSLELIDALAMKFRNKVPKNEGFDNLDQYCGDTYSKDFQDKNYFQWNIQFIDPQDISEKRFYIKFSHRVEYDLFEEGRNSTEKISGLFYNLIDINSDGLPDEVGRHIITLEAGWEIKTNFTYTNPHFFDTMYQHLITESLKAMEGKEADLGPEFIEAWTKLKEDEAKEWKRNKECQ